MKVKKQLLIPLLASIICISTLGIFLVQKDGTPLFAGTGPDRWVHYKKREATSSQVGIREYWMHCGIGYQFTAPVSYTRMDEALDYDTSAFETNDPRYIFYLADNINPFYSLATSKYDFSECTTLNGYSSNSYATKYGETKRVEFYKDDNSPMYSANCLTVSMCISSNVDLSTLQSSIANSTGLEGLYYQTANLSNPNTYVSVASGAFSGTYDGRGHTISSPSFWGRRMFGKLTNATVKNLTFNNVSVFSIFCTDITSSTLENITVNTATTLNKYSGSGLLCDYLKGKPLLKDITIDYRDNYLAGATPIAGYNYADSDATLYDNVTIRCLETQNMYLGDYIGRKLRPNEIKYISSYYFIQNGVANYTIKYVDGNTSISEAAAFIKSEIYNATGININLYSISSSEIIGHSSSCIVIGSSASLNSEGIALPTNEGEYIAKAIDKAIYLYSNNKSNYLALVIHFLEKMIGFDYIGEGIRINTLTDKNNVKIANFAEIVSPSFLYRKCDWSDSKSVTNFEPDALAYNEGYEGHNTFMYAPAVGQFTSKEQYHTTMMVMYPEVYYGSHNDWYATDSNGSTFGSNYKQWQLCYTAHGNSAEYQSMVNQAGENIISLFAANKTTNQFVFGVADNTNYCHCSACQTATANYGSLCGATVKFVNDVSNYINSNISRTGHESVNLILFSYYAYKDAPLKNGEPTIRCNDNVRVFVAPIEANYTYALNSDKNPLAYQTFENWKNVGSIYAWLYETNFHAYLYPFNSYKAMTDTLKYLNSVNVKMIYALGQHNAPQPRTGFTALKKYLDGKFQLDVNNDYDSLVNKFFSVYYGKQGDSMKSFFNAVTERLSTLEESSTARKVLYKDTDMSIYQNIADKSLWNFSDVEDWKELCDKAYSNENDATCKKHILIESIFPKFALCTIFSSRYLSSKLKTMRQAFKADAESLGLKLTTEYGTTLQSYYDSWGV